MAVFQTTYSKCYIRKYTDLFKFNFRLQTLQTEIKLNILNTFSSFMLYRS